VRLGGPRARAIAARLFVPRTGKPGAFSERKAVFGSVRDPATRDFLDEGFLLFFPAPRSYTRQDVIEISLHGSPAVLEETVRLAIKAGARPAHPGEFTLRAYWSGRLDILQAEAVDDLVRSVSLIQARIASRQVRGGLTDTIGTLRADFVELLADLEAAIEFPDDRMAVNERTVFRRLDAMALRLTELIRSYETGKALSEGLTLALVGKANVGKSTLFNALLGESRAIVAPEAGTTRDYLRERIRIEETAFRLVDTAGLRRAETAIEKEGLRRSLEQAGGADGIIFLFDRSRPASAADLALVRRFRGKKAILVFNKCDRPPRLKCGSLKRAAPAIPSAAISALTGAGIPGLERLIHDVFAPKAVDGGDVILHLRQKTILEEMAACVAGGRESLGRGESFEVVSEEIRRTLPAAEKLLGAIRMDDVIESVFARFCVGK
ncbi:MAG: tRNA uridine-5-carboxymethylaminomethyl(34) synthesis GTPase MnmE, partial [Candidatus Aminicenantales bacterium]